jgi:hypothetical protein
MHINNIPNDFKFMRKILINLVYAACTWTLSSFIFWVDWKKILIGLAQTTLHGKG